MNFYRYKARFPTTSRPVKMPLSYCWTFIFGLYFFSKLYLSFYNSGFILLASLLTAMFLAAIDVYSSKKRPQKQIYLFLISLLFIASLAETMFKAAFDIKDGTVGIFNQASASACVYFGGILFFSIIDWMRMLAEIQDEKWEKL